jgi:hypothetical protein
MGGLLYLKVYVSKATPVSDGVSTKATDSSGVPWGTAVPKGVSMATAVSDGVSTKATDSSCVPWGAAVLKGVSMATAVSDGVTTKASDSYLGGLLYLTVYPWRLLY